MAVRTLRDHLDIDVVVTKHAEESATDTNHVLELLSNQAHNGHVRHNVDGAQVAEVVDGALEILVLDPVLVLAAATKEGRFRVQGHRDVDLGGRNEIHRQMPAIQDAKDVHQETVGTGTLVAVDVEHNNIVLDGDSSRALGGVKRVQQARRARAEESVPERRVRTQGLQVVRENDGASTTRVHDVLDADGDAGADDLLHGEGVDNLRAVKGQLSSLRGRDAGEQSRGRDLARVSGEDAVHLLPDLQLFGLGAHGNQRCAEIGISTTNRVQQTAWNVAKEASDNGDLVTAGLNLPGQCCRQVCVELLVQALLRGVEGDDVGEVHELGGRATVVEKGSHVATAELLALSDDLVLDAVGDLLKVLGRLEDLGQRLALGIDVLGEGCEDVGAPDGVLCGLDVVDADGLDNVIVAAVALLLGGAGGAEEAVGGALGLVLGAARRTDDSGAVDLVAGPEDVLLVSVLCGHGAGVRLT